MSAVIVPTVTAYDLHEYRQQLERVAAFAPRVHIDLMDGIFAPTKSPDITHLWVPKGVKADVHVMFRHPDKQIRKILDLNPSLVIVQAEADQASVRATIAGIKKTRVGVGISLLAATSVNEPFAAECVALCQYVLIFSGNLGFHGGEADLSLLRKIDQIRVINSTCEIAWDGGINAENAQKLADAGVSVLNTGGAIQKADDPALAYKQLVALVT